MEKCNLCLSETLIPVQLKCFECYHSYLIHCHSYNRICMLCFLGKKNDKCFICQSPQKQNVYPKFEIDYDRIRADSFSIYTCPICLKYKGSHIDVCKHFLSHHIYECKCGEILQNDDSSIMNHKKICKLCDYCAKCKIDSKSCPCCDNKIVSCRFCNEMISKKNLMNHCLNHIKECRTKVKILRELLNNERRQYHLLLEKIEEDYDTL